MTMLGYPCPVCGREGGAVSIQVRGGKVAQLCSMECAKVHIMRPATFTPNEKEAIREGGYAGGEVLERIGKSDLARLTDAEFLEFCGAVIGGYTEALRKAADDEIPF